MHTDGDVRVFPKELSRLGKPGTDGHNGRGERESRFCEIAEGRVDPLGKSGIIAANEEDRRIASCGRLCGGWQRMKQEKRENKKTKQPVWRHEMVREEEVKDVGMVEGGESLGGRQTGGPDD